MEKIVRFNTTLYPSEIARLTRVAESLGGVRNTHADAIRLLIREWEERQKKNSKKSPAGS